MNWYYVDQGQQAGPVDDARLEDLRRIGKIQPETLVWREGMANWAAYSAVVSAAAGEAPPVMAPGSVVCAECRRVFPEDQTIRYGTVNVCAACKPVFLQKLAEGVSVGHGGAGNLSEQEILQREYKIDIGEAMSRAWATFSANAGIAIGALIVVLIVLLTCSAISAAVGMVIPFANAFVSVLYTAPLNAGVLWLFLQLARNRPAGVGDAFVGFGKQYGQVVLYGFVQWLLVILSLLPLIVIAIAFGLLATFQPGTPRPEMAVGILFGVTVAIVIAVCAIIYISVLLTFTPLLIIDKGYRLWPAMQLSRRMVSRRWWMTLWFLFVSGVVYTAGFFLCVVGLLASAPVYFGMKAVLYDDNFGDLARPS